MTTRPSQDWTPLDWTCDPIPGDPGDVRITGMLMSRTADAAEGAAGHLRRLVAGDGQCSDAISKILVQAGEAATDLDRVKVRYSGAATALMEYAEVLSDAQATSLRALQAAEPANDQRRQANEGLSRVQMRAENSIDPQERQELISQLYLLKATRDDARSDLEGAKAALRQAIEDRDKGAWRAKAEVDNAVRTSQLNDSGWDKTKHALQTIGPVVLDVIAAALTVVAVILATTVVGAPFAALVGWVALGAGVASSALSMWKEWEEGDGQGFATAALFGVLAAIPGGRLVKLLRLSKASLGLKAAGRLGTYGKTFFSFAKKKEMAAIADSKKAWVLSGRRAHQLVGRPAEQAAQTAKREAQRAYEKLVNDQVVISADRARVKATEAARDVVVTGLKWWAAETQRDGGWPNLPPLPPGRLIVQGCPA